MKYRDAKSGSVFKCLPFLIALGLGALLCPPAAYTKPKPPPRPTVGITFPDQDAKVGDQATFKLHLSCPARWKSAEITTRVSAVKTVAKKSDAASVTCPTNLTAASGTDRRTGTVAVPFTVAKNGEYLIEVSVRYKAGDATAGRATNTAAVLTENGKSWLGLGSIEYAFIERTKADLEIDGPPRGAALARLNAALKIWDEKRQKAALRN